MTIHTDYVAVTDQLVAARAEVLRLSNERDRLASHGHEALSLIDKVSDALHRAGVGDSPNVLDRIAMAGEELTKLRKEITRLRSENTNLVTQDKLCTEHRIQLESEVERLTNELAKEVDDNRKQWMSGHASLRNTVTKLGNTVAKLESEKNALQEDLDHLIKVRQETHGILTANKVDGKEVRVTARARMAELAAAQQEVAELTRLLEAETKRTTPFDRQELLASLRDARVVIRAVWPVYQQLTASTRALLEAIDVTSTNFAPELLAALKAAGVEEP
jgi:chromosome segregation ATPase